MSPISDPSELPDPALLAASRETLAKTALQTSDAELDRALRELARRIDAVDGIQTLASDAKTRAPSTLQGNVDRWRGTHRLGHALRPTQMWRIVAATLGIALLAMTGATLLSRRVASGVGDAVTTYVTADGERANILMPDGTHVILNVGSRIDIPRHFGEHDRVVRLRGEAYFTVPHAAGSPFVIEAGGARTTVLGTEFGVRTYQPTDVQVAVHTGKVALNNVVLSAHDIAHTAPGGAVVVARQQSLDAVFAFTRGRLVIANQPLRDALPDLDRWFAADIRFGDPTLGDVRFDAVLMSGSIGDLMEVLENTLDVRIVREGHTLTLYAR